jgi:ribosomal subunit interface protein
MDIVFTGRHTDVLERFRQHAIGKLAKIEKLDHRAIRVDVAVTTEHNPRQAGRKERVELTITTRGPAIRAEAAAEDRFSALDLALAKLESRLRRASDRLKDRYGSAAHPETVAEAALPAAALSDAVPASRPAPESAERPAAEDGEETIVPIEMEGDGPLVVREKTHVATPMTIDQALFEMELIGHDFFLFTDTGAGLPSVVYRRRGYQYGVIRLVAEPVPDGSAGLTGRAARPAANLATG